MTEAVAERMAALNAHEARFMFESFDHAAAWQLGTQMVERALRDALPVIIDIGSRLRAPTHGQQSGSTPPRSRRPAAPSPCASTALGSSLQ